MTDRPIIFSAPMVLALLADRKTQTRRLIKKPAALDCLAVFGPAMLMKPGCADLVPYAIGDRLWVRESIASVWELDENDRQVGDDPELIYRADGYPYDRYLDTTSGEWRDEPPWTPSIHMPRLASRLTLTVTDVRVQRLQDMEGQHSSESDAIAEGVNAIHHGDGDFYYSAFRDEPHPKNWCDPTDAFRELWNSLHGPESWGANPWIVALTFTVDRRNIDA